MKIAFLSPFYPYRGGIANFSDSFFEELRKSNEIKAYTFKRQYPKLLFPGTSQYVLDTDIKKDIDAVKVLDSINPLSFNATVKTILKHSPELVLISYWMPFFAPSLGRIAKKIQQRGIKVISILHNVLPHEPRLGDRALTKYFLNHCDGAVVLNEKSKTDLQKISPNIKYIIHQHPFYNHYGTKLDVNKARTELDIPAGKKVVLFFGLIRDYKGLDLFIDAASMLDSEYFFVIAGESYDNYEKYSNKIKDLDLESKFKQQIKYIPDSEVPLYFSASDVCVLPYRSGTQSGIIGIAYHFDVPVIVTDVGGLKEVVEENKTGLIVKEPSAELIAEAIKKYFNEGLKEKFQQGIQVLKLKHSWSSLASDIINFYKTL